MTIPRVPNGTRQALSPGQRQAIEDFYGALTTHDVDLVDQALTPDWEDIPLAACRTHEINGRILKQMESASAFLATEFHHAGNLDSFVSLYG